jgi:hypothetical protein
MSAVSLRREHSNVKAESRDRNIGADLQDHNSLSFVRLRTSYSRQHS